ncbi:MAG: TonB-dependent receptor plug domain-containing protein [Chroococcales cyanobacterium]
MKLERWLSWSFVTIGLIGLISPKSLAAIALNSPSSKIPNLNTIVASCLLTALDSFPRTATVIRRSQIEQQSIVTRNTAEILTQLVPSATRTASGNLTLRGRRPRIFIDGIPVSNNLTVIDPDAIEKIEVIPGNSDRCY